jgi:hypothetical protein
MKTMAKKKDTSRRAGNKHKLIGLRLEESKRQEVQDMATAERRSLAMMCAILIEEALAARKGKQ